ncbi:MAG: hypothetical protein ACRDRH_01405 [Pseudonocardia sp.]
MPAPRAEHNPVRAGPTGPRALAASTPGPPARARRRRRPGAGRVPVEFPLALLVERATELLLRAHLVDLRGLGQFVTHDHARVSVAVAEHAGPDVVAHAAKAAGADQRFAGLESIADDARRGPAARRARDGDDLRQAGAALRTHRPIPASDGLDLKPGDQCGLAEDRPEPLGILQPRRHGEQVQRLDVPPAVAACTL